MPSMLKQEIENPMICPHFERYIREAYTACGCDRVAVYMVDDEPHCKSCMLGVIDTEDVKVRLI